MATSSVATAESQAPAGAPAVESVGVDRLAADNTTIPCGREYVPDLGVNNPHAKAVFTGGDTYERPQRFNMHRDTTFDAVLFSKRSLAT